MTIKGRDEGRDEGREGEREGGREVECGDTSACLSQVRRTYHVTGQQRLRTSAMA